MLQKGLLKKESSASRKYYINILYNPILRGFVETLTKEGFLNFENDNLYSQKQPHNSTDNNFG